MKPITVVSGDKSRYKFFENYMKDTNGTVTIIGGSELPEHHIKELETAILMRGMTTRNLLILSNNVYVYSKLNSLLKSGEIAKNETKREKVLNLVPENLWLTHDQLDVFHVVNGVAKDIVDKEDGIIGSYELDQMSETLSEEFSSLLDIQFDME